MKPRNKHRSFSEKNEKKMQELISRISYFVTTHDKLKGCIVNIKHAKYYFAPNTLKIGYSTLDGKYGTVKEKLLKSSRELSDYLFSLNLYKFPPKIEFAIQKEDEKVAKVQEILERIQKLEDDKS